MWHDTEHGTPGVGVSRAVVSIESAVRQNIITCNAAKIACGTTVQQKGGTWQQALCSLFQFAECSVQPGTITCNATFSAFETFGKWHLALVMAAKPAETTVHQTPRFAIALVCRSV